MYAGFHAGSFGEPVTDKWVQGYLPAYLEIAADLGMYARVLELGVQSGLSLLLWTRLFPRGEVTGVDCDDEAYWPPGTVRVVGDAADPALAAKLGGPFNLIVDDASHQGEDVAAAFANLWPLVKPGGFYVIEDWYVGLPGWTGPAGNPAMLTAVQGLLLELSGPDAAAEQVTFRFGLAIVHKRRT